uniref:Nuclear receptor coactivator 7a n=1 Tax=Poecilia latipinna TaxID=48699 RepID=A0A3B3UHQ2_9TELE
MRSVFLRFTLNNDVLFSLDCEKFTCVQTEPRHRDSGSDEALEPEHTLPVLKRHSHLLLTCPQRPRGYPWQLVHSTTIHGTSLQTLYRNTANLDSPVLLLVKDMFKKVFGAFCSDPFRVSKYFYDAGETFLFSFGPDFQVGDWFCEFCILVG